MYSFLVVLVKKVVQQTRSSSSTINQNKKMQQLNTFAYVETTNILVKLTYLPFVVTMNTNLDVC